MTLVFSIDGTNDPIPSSPHPLFLSCYQVINQKADGIPTKCAILIFHDNLI